MHRKNMPPNMFQSVLTVLCYSALAMTQAVGPAAYDLSPQGRNNAIDSSNSPKGAIATGSRRRRTRVPGQFMDLRRWKLTLPIGRGNKATEVQQPALSKFVHPHFFRMNPTNDAISFVAFSGGKTTSRRTKYPRR
jgi:hypothetical protein